ncbi:CLUMA_CG003170, isoform A [Clunio marinus]|uniref:CLUMA_CG003170, isoform A n=1 Tax=Clunio marinus TaxID=568069 RepID=A0A1J1HMZ3_9DIPT|nr:CLUMA_CG003170, isoform A [Clunio marinus]
MNLYIWEYSEGSGGGCDVGGSSSKGLYFKLHETIRRKARITKKEMLCTSFLSFLYTLEESRNTKAFQLDADYDVTQQRNT